MHAQLHLEDLLWGAVIPIALFLAARYWREIFGMLKIFGDYALQFRIYPSPGVTAYPRNAMSSWDDDGDDNRPVVAPVVQQTTIARQPIATTDNRDNDELTDNALLPEEVRDIIRFQAKVEALAELVRSGQVTNMAKGIEKTFGCSRSSKEESIYQRAHRALAPLVQDSAQYRTADGGVEPPTHPITGRAPLRTHAR